MGETSIPCREDTRDRLRDDKTSGVSWDRYLNDLLDAAERADDHANGAEVDAIADAVADRLGGDVTLEASERKAIAREVAGELR